MLQWFKVLGVAAILAVAGGAAQAQSKADRAAICAKHADPARKDACLKRADELNAAREAKREAQAAKAKEAQARINAVCTAAADRGKCERDERAKLKAGRAKAKEKPKKPSEELRK